MFFDDTQVKFQEEIENKIKARNFYATKENIFCYFLQ